jgi:hypothetical protein
MTDAEIQPYINNDVLLVVPMNRRTTMSVFGYLTTATHTQTGEACYQLQGNVNFLFFPQDVQSVEVSERAGTVVRLY